MSSSDALLQVEDLHVSFGGNHVLRGVDLVVRENEITALIGPNGSGKTTLFNAVTGFVNPSHGHITFEGRRIDSLSVHRRGAAGLMRTFQEPQLFDDFTVVENVALGMFRSASPGLLRGLLAVRSSRRQMRSALGHAREVLEKYGLGDVALERARDLPAGAQRNVELVRAVVSSPRLLLLDEPSSGLTADEVDEFMAAVQAVSTKGTTVFVVSHDMRLVRQLASRAYVLNFGDIIAEGTPAQVQSDEAVREVYLGSRKVGAEQEEGPR
jgi:ABC-type branched-subunit amino acid transport system ATPase component